MNIEHTLAVVSKALDNNLTPILWGKAGIGKSMIIRQLAEKIAEKDKLTFTDDYNLFDEKHFGIVDLRLGQMEVGDLIGMPNISDNGNGGKTSWSMPNWFPNHIKGRGILFLDELNRGRLDVIQAVFQLVWDKKLHTHKLPRGWGIVVACNPSGSEYFVNELDTALMDRFVHIKLTPEVKEWVSWAKNEGKILEGITDFIEKYPEALGNEGCEVPIEIKPSPRSYQVLSMMLNGLQEELWLETSMGIVGNEIAIPLIESFKKNLEKPVRAIQVLNTYTKWKSKIKKFGSTENSRFDLLRITCDDIERILKKDYVDEDNDLSEQQERNLVDFIRDLPSDLSFAVIKTLVSPERMGTDKFNQMLCKYNDIYDKLSKVANLEKK